MIILPIVKTERRDAMGSRLTREPMVVQEPEARLSDGQVSVIISLKSGPKTLSRVRSEAWAGPVHAFCLG